MKSGHGMAVGRQGWGISQLETISTCSPGDSKESSPSSCCTRLPCPGHLPGIAQAAGAPVCEGGCGAAHG